MMFRGRQKSLFILCAGVFASTFAHADEASLIAALKNTYTACVGIDDELSDLKKMAGINTVVTGVGTGLGAGATIVGIVKASKDASARHIADKINYTQRPYNVIPTQADMDEMREEFSSQKPEDEFKKLRQESKTLGDWRTGLMVGNTATNVVGVIISSKNRVNDDLQSKIDNCKLAVKNLQTAMMQAKLEDIDISEAQTIYNTCKEYDYIDISKINNRATGATISSAVGAGLGLTGTITSGVANSESIRKDNIEIQNKTAADWEKEKNINTAANILAGASTVASATATVFNATQIKAIKDVVNVATKCTEALK